MFVRSYYSATLLQSPKGSASTGPNTGAQVFIV